MNTCNAFRLQNTVYINNGRTESSTFIFWLAFYYFILHSDTLTPFNSDIDLTQNESTTHGLGAKDHVLLPELISSFKPQSIEQIFPLTQS